MFLGWQFRRAAFERGDWRMWLHVDLANLHPSGHVDNMTHASAVHQ